MCVRKHTFHNFLFSYRFAHVPYPTSFFLKDINLTEHFLGLSINGGNTIFNEAF